MKILNITIFGDDQDTGASRVYDLCWRDVSAWAEVITVKPGERPSIERLPPAYTKLTIRTPKLSALKIVRSAARRIFGDREPQIMADLDDMVRALVLAFRLRRVTAASDRVHSDSMWFTVIASLFPKTRGKVSHTELAGDWKFVSDGTADFLTYLSYGCLGRRVLNGVRVIAQSPVHAAYLVSCGVDRKVIDVVLHGRVDSRSFHPTTPKSPIIFNILFVGRLVPQKGAHVLLNAVSLLVSSTGATDVRLAIVGPVGEFGLSLATSDYFEELQRITKDCGLSPYVEFKRFVSQQELVSLYSSADVYVLPSLQDALPFSVVEAMMCGTPVVGTTSGGMKEEIVDGVTGFLVSPGEAEALAGKLRLLYQNPTLRAKLGISARADAMARFSLEGFAKEVFDAVARADPERPSRFPTWG
jgi:glycosyltransferase involved in cell wall biosynthesis